MNPRQYWIPFLQQLKQLLQFVKTCCLPHTLFPSILENDSFAVKIISGRELGEKMKLFTNSSSHTHQKPVKISSLSQEWFSRNNFPREIFAKITTLHSSVPIPCCCLSCSYKSILGKKLRGEFVENEYYFLPSLIVLEHPQQVKRRISTLLFTSINAKHNIERIRGKEKINLCSSSHCQ